MTNRRGRPPIADQAALRQVAEHIISAEEKGIRCSIRAAILRTSDRVTGNSPDAMLWRLQRKWRRHGPPLLAEARERRAMRRHVTSVPLSDGRLGSAVDEVMRMAQTLQEAMRPALGLQNEIRRVAQRESEAMRAALGLQDEIRRMALLESEVMRAVRLRHEITRALGG